jgi:hypothetical protein
MARLARGENVVALCHFDGIHMKVQKKRPDSAAKEVREAGG